jgi:alkaline phosphatase
MRPRTRIAAAVALAMMVALVVQPAASGKPAPQPTAPKSVILIIGDGMGPAHLELSRKMLGTALKVDGFPVNGSVDTLSLDGITDSAAAATALATGFATLNSWLSMTPDGQPHETVLERAESKGKATGLITDNTEPSATPAAFAVHVSDRDEDLAITQQYAEKDIEVLFSGGWGESYLLEGRSGVTYVDNLSELQPYLDGQTSYPNHMYGFFGQTDLAYNLDREEEGAIGIQPMLPELTKAAFGVLGQDPDGFFLMVEAGENDWGGHSRDAAWVAAEMAELNDTVAVALEYQRTHERAPSSERPGAASCSARSEPRSRQQATVEWMGACQAPPREAVEQTLIPTASRSLAREPGSR